jgi:K+-sensing histidine kinase KdpD
MLGARLHIEEGDDVAAVGIRLARSLGSTYVLLGTPSPPKGLRRFGGAAASDRALPMRLLRGLPGVDIRIIADPALRGEPGEGVEPDGAEESGRAEEPHRAAEAAVGGAVDEDVTGVEEPGA